MTATDWKVLRLVCARWEARDVTEIAQRTKLSRSTVYRSLGRLAERGHVSNAHGVWWATHRGSK